MNHLESLRKLLNRFAVWLYKKTKPKAPESPYGHFMGMKVCVSDLMPKDTIFLGTGEFNRLENAVVLQEIDPIAYRDLYGFGRMWNSAKSNLRQNVSP